MQRGVRRYADQAGRVCLGQAQGRIVVPVVLVGHIARHDDLKQRKQTVQADSG